MQKQIKKSVREVLIDTANELSPNLQSGLTIVFDERGDPQMWLLNTTVQQLSFTKEMLTRAIFAMMDERRVEPPVHRGPVLVPNKSEDSN